MFCYKNDDVIENSFCTKLSLVLTVFIYPFLLLSYIKRWFAVVSGGLRWLAVVWGRCGISTVRFVNIHHANTPM